MNVRLKYFLLLFLLFLPVIASSSAFSPNSLNPKTTILGGIDSVTQIVIILILFLIILAALVYAVGQVFGAETRAKATAWSMSLLTGAGLGILILVMVSYFLPNYQIGQASGPFSNLEFASLDLKGFAQGILFSLIILLIITAALIYMLGQSFPAETRARATVWANTALGAALVAAVIYAIIFSIFSDLQSSFFVGTGLERYADLVISVAIFVAAFILITYILARIFRIPEWEAYLGVELGNLVNSFLVVLFVVGFLTVASMIATDQVNRTPGLTVSPGFTYSPAQAAISKMQGIVTDSVLRGIYDVYTIQACTSVLSTYNKRIGEMVLASTYKIYPGIDTFVSITNGIGFGLISVYGSISAQIALLYMLDTLVMNFLLPAGLILRFIPPLRDAGGFIIALSLGFLVVYPMSYLINLEVYTSIGGTGYDTPPLLVQSICGPFKYGFWGIALNSGGNPIFSLQGMGVARNTIVPFLANIVSEGYLNAISMGEFVVIMQHIAELSLLALFMPTLAMVVTIAFINTFTKFILSKV